MANELWQSLQTDKRFTLYADILLEWNAKINLTSITARDEIYVKHFEDSLTCAGYIPNGASVADVGTGGGFPGVPLKIARGDIKITLMDALQKRIIFLRELCARLQTDAECVHIRAEDAGRDAARRETFDVAVSRAVTSLPALAEYCLPLVRKGGVMLAMKGGDCAAEVASALSIIDKLGGAVRSVDLHTLSGGIAHSIVVIDKTGPTPKQYPRRGRKIGT